MADITNEQVEDEIMTDEISDAALEAAALAMKTGGYTQFGLCTVSFCPGDKRRARQTLPAINAAPVSE